MDEEMESLENSQTWILMPLPLIRKAIKCKWVYNSKRKPDESIDHFKARLCAEKYSQEVEIDYTGTFAPVASYDSIRTLLSIAAVHNLKIQQFEVRTAFLNGSLHVEIYMAQSPAYENLDSFLVCKLNNSLYGLKLSPYCWNKTFIKFLSAHQYEQFASDESVFEIVYKGGEILLALFVDGRL
ncbi:hypothetical protein JTB14_025018 [Gonioctena quinquepunctata]|nr:hypothetical protein JTB14_025018 [Gonioctena quinquepunctata]